MTEETSINAIAKMLQERGGEEVSKLGEKVVPTLIEIISTKQADLRIEHAAKIAMARIGEQSIPYILEKLKNKAYGEDTLIELLGEIKCKNHRQILRELKGLYWMCPNGVLKAMTHLCRRTADLDAIEFLGDKFSMNTDSLPVHVQTDIAVALRDTLPDSYSLVLQLLNRSLHTRNIMIRVISKDPDRSSALKRIEMFLDAGEVSQNDYGAQMLGVFLESILKEPENRQDAILLKKEICTAIKKVSGETTRGRLQREFARIYALAVQELGKQKSIVELGGGVLSEGLPTPPKGTTYRTNATWRQFA